MPPLPDPGTRWYSAMESMPTACVDVVRDNRYKQCRRVRFLNLLEDAPVGDTRHSARPVVQPEEFGRQWTQQPRVFPNWINTGSIWRRLPKEGWLDRDPHEVLTLAQLVVVSRISNGGSITYGRMDPDGTLHEAGSLSEDRRVLPFTRVHCRMWATNIPPEDPANPAELFPEILYRFGLLQRPTPPPELTPKPKPPKRRAAKARRKRLQPPPTAWERLMGDRD